MVERLNAAVDHAEGGIECKAGGVAFELPRSPDVIRIEKGDVLAARGGDPGIPGGAGAEVLLADDNDSMAVAVQNLRRVVGRAVVDDDDLESGTGLRQRTVDRVAKKATVVVRRDDDGDRRHGCRTF